MTVRKFHHGHLRAALLAGAAADIEELGLDALSLRRLAARLGVSSPAVYRHYENKVALLRALADEGLDEITALYREALAADLSPLERLRSACGVYLDFARRRPQLYRLIFAAESGWFREEPLGERGSTSFTLFKRLVCDASGTVGAEATRTAAIGCWSLIHGYAMLRLDDRITSSATDAALEDYILDTATRSVLPVNRPPQSAVDSEPPIDDLH